VEEETKKESPDTLSSKAKEKNLNLKSPAFIPAVTESDREEFEKPEDNTCYAPTESTDLTDSHTKNKVEKSEGASLKAQSQPTRAIVDSSKDSTAAAMQH
jgi:hypothetical protein